MSKELTFANHLLNQYFEITGEHLDELKLHKMMYFSQKLAYGLTNTPIFLEDFEGWVHGPVLPSLRGYFKPGYTHQNSEELTDTEEYIANCVIHEYGQYTSWGLRNLSHEESAWQKSREGFNADERGNNKILKSDISEDAMSIRIYDHDFDMYVDEFEDAEGI